MDMKSRMLYFGPWNEPGHYLFHENGTTAWREAKVVPWRRIDGCLQPGCIEDPGGHWSHRGSPEIEGKALLHHKDGWTALSFWDRSVDKRGACNSNYFAEGTFSFTEMVEMAKTRFAYRWNKMTFPVTEYKAGMNSEQKVQMINERQRAE